MDTTLPSLFLLQTTHLIVNNVEKAQDSYKSRMAQKWKVPVLSVDYISKCVEAGKLLEADPFVVVGRTASEEFRSGKIVGERVDISLEIIVYSSRQQETV